MARTPKKTTAPTDKSKKTTKAAAATTKEVAKKPVVRKKPAKGYQKPEHIPNGEILIDTTKQQWKIGPSIGSGGFGEIYSACKLDGSAKKSVDYPFVLKIEPHSNGPLFVEMHFYMRNGKWEDIEAFRKKRGLKLLGMPHFLGHGSHDLNDIKHRFLVIPKFGRDIWSIFLENNKKIPLPTIYRLALQMSDVLEYIHDRSYVHGDLKGANILLGLGKIGQSQAYLVDFGLASHYTTKDYKPDPKKMHNGTIEYTSRDAHNGVPTMRGDLEILAFNLVHWSGITLPWEANKLLTNPTKVQESKEQFMKNLDKTMVDLYGSKNNYPDPIYNLFKMINSLKYDQKPDYSKIRKLFEDGLKSLGKTNTGDLVFKITTSSAPATKTTKQVNTRLSRSTLSSNDENDNGESSPVPTTSRQRRQQITTPKEIASINVKRIDDKKSKKRSTLDSEDDEKEDNEENDTNDKSPERKKIRRKQNDAKNGHDISPKDVVNNEIVAKGKRNGKTYELNLELNISLDANVIVNVKRKTKPSTKNP